MLFSEFCSVLSKAEETTSRNTITELLSGLFCKSSPEEIGPMCLLLLGQILPAYEGLEFQFGSKMMVRALAAAYDVPIKQVQETVGKIGDVATVAAHYASIHTGSDTTQTVSAVYEQLFLFAKENGEGSQERKLQIVQKMLRTLDAQSVKYFVRIVLTKLRLGFSDMTLLDALSWAKKGDKSDRELIEDAYQRLHDIRQIAASYLFDGTDSLAAIDVLAGVPIQPALCQRLKTATEMIQKMHDVIVEPKYDGTRVQIHIQKTKFQTDWQVRTYTRSLEESSAQFPELRTVYEGILDCEVILDCEAVGFDPLTKKMLPFQETIQRKRKHDVDETAARIPLRFYIFDILFLNNRSLLKVPLHERKKILHEFLVAHKSEYFVESPYIITNDADVLRDFHKKQLNAGLEGAVVKQKDSMYQPGRKGWSWVKFKEEEDSVAKLSDTVDAVVMGYWYGKGKRTQFGIGAFLIGILGDNEKILTLSKVGTGLSDEQWRELYTRCQPLVSATMPGRYEVAKALLPDVWVDPEIVAEVAGDELTKSSTHSAGVALRFPRLVRFRDDKKVENITTKKELHSIQQG